MQKIERIMNRKWAVTVCLVIIIAVQCAICCYYGTQKNAFHEDEIYTYELANDEGGLPRQQEGFLESWQTGSFYHDVMSVTPEERFDFSIPYDNQKYDVHPFLYYFAVHLVCSIFPEANWKWPGILLNLCFCVVTSVALYKLARRVTNSRAMALICVIIWACGVCGVVTTIFLRMYAMLTMWCTIFLLLMVIAVQREWQERPVKPWFWLAPCLITTAGILTQYYFMVFCLLAAVTAFVILLIRRAWKRGLWMIAAELVGAYLAYRLFPAMRRHILYSYRGEELQESSFSLRTYGNDMKDVGVIISKQLLNNSAYWVILAAVALLIVFVVIRRVRAKRGLARAAWTVPVEGEGAAQLGFASHREQWALLSLPIVTSMGYIAVICAIAPYQVDRYYMCVYPALALVCVDLLFLLVRYIVPRKRAIYVLGLSLAVFLVVMSHIQRHLPYLYTYCSAREEALSDYLDYPVIVINGAEYDDAPDMWNYEYEMFPAIYRCSAGSFEGLTHAAETMDLSDGFVLYAQFSTLLGEELMDEVSRYIDISDWSLITDLYTSVYFCEVAETP